MTGLNYERLYAYRFAGIDQDARAGVWKAIAEYMYETLGKPERVLDPAGGRCEFINAIPAAERWTVDKVSHVNAFAAPGVKLVVADIFDAELPQDHFDAIFVSNFLEHLPTHDLIADFLAKMHRLLRPGGRIAILGPNFRYCADNYFDCADHYLALTDVAVAEHLYAAGLTPQRVVPKFLPYSFRGKLPPSEMLTSAYLKFPPAWRILGKQFLVIATK